MPPVTNHSPKSPPSTVEIPPKFSSLAGAHDAGLLQVFFHFNIFVFAWAIGIINVTVLLAASRQGFKYCTWFISSKMYRNTEDIKFEIYVKISTGTTISQEMIKQTVNKNNIHVPVGVSQVSQLVVMILLINDCYVMSLVVIISRMNFVLYRNTPPPLEKESYIKNTKFISSPVSRRVFQFQKN